ncbi:MAG: adenylate/guanylate cyclase domain-containing protein [Oscillatoriales cyanobacterium]|nr:MAG: adenylate/guanylate cyclase domain-containing protein [Oscillatoriales cyanobacterium]
MFLKSLLRPFYARLSRKVAVGVLGSIVAIEVVILVPSYWRRERELIQYIHHTSTAKILAVSHWLDHSQAPEKHLGLIRKLVGQDGDPIALWRGMAMYERSGKLIGMVGDYPPDLTFHDFQVGLLEKVSHDQRHLDLVWPANSVRNYVLIIRHDMAPIRQELQAFTLRITGLILLISFFATGVTMIVLSRVAILPILRLRDDLQRAADLISREDMEATAFYASQADQSDELGEVMIAFRQMYDRIHQEILDRRRAERESESLLLNILPPAIAERLKRGEHPIAERFENVTVLFADLVNFTGLASSITPSELVQQLNEIFSTFDALADHYQLEKIKTIGDAYMVVGGVPSPLANCTAIVAEMALAMQKAIAEYTSNGNRSFSIRIGIHTGPVVGGVIGIRKFIYDLWGDTVNTASRMESHGMPGKIQVTEAVYQKLCDRFTLEPRGAIAIKGKGMMNTYWLCDRNIGANVDMQSEHRVIEPFAH